MDFWLSFPRFVQSNLDLFGWPVFVSAWLVILLPSLIARTKHARSQDPPVPSFPFTPPAHFRLWGYAFSRDAWLSQGLYGRTLLFAFRISFLIGLLGVTTLFLTSLSAEATAPHP
jgi:hypothetical protein